MDVLEGLISKDNANASDETSSILKYVSYMIRFSIDLHY